VRGGGRGGAGPGGGPKTHPTPPPSRGGSGGGGHLCARRAPPTKVDPPRPRGTVEERVEDGADGGPLDAHGALAAGGLAQLCRQLDLRHQTRTSAPSTSATNLSNAR